MDSWFLKPSDGSYWSSFQTKNHLSCYEIWDKLRGDIFFQVARAWSFMDNSKSVKLYKAYFNRYIIENTKNAQAGFATEHILISFHEYVNEQNANGLISTRVPKCKYWWSQSSALQKLDFAKYFCKRSIFANRQRINLECW